MIENVFLMKPIWSCKRTFLKCLHNFKTRQGKMTSEEYMISHQNVHQQPVLIIFCVISVQPQWKGALARCLSDEIRLHCISERRVIPHDSNRPPGQPSSGTRTPCRPVLRIIATCGGVICCRQGSGVACAVQAIPDTISIGFVYLFFP